MSEKKVEVKLTADTQALKKSLDEISAKMTSAQEFTKALLTKDLLPALDEIVTAINSIIPALQKVNNMNQKVIAGEEKKLLLSKQLSKQELEQYQIELEASLKKAKSTDEINKKYEKRAELINQLKEKEKELVNEHYKGLLDANMQEEEYLKLQKERLDRLDNIKEEQSEALFANTKEKIEAYKTLLDSSLADITKGIEEKTHKGGFWKGIVDVDATRESIDNVKKELEKYKSTLSKNKEDTVKHYDDLLKTYNEDSDEYKRIQNEKIEAAKLFDEELKKVDSSITDTQKKGKELRGKQMAAYIEQLTKDGEEIAKKAEKWQKQINSAFNQLTAGISNSIKKTIEDQEKLITKQDELIAKSTETQQKAAEEQESINNRIADKEYELSVLRSELTEGQIKTREREIESLKRDSKTQENIQKDSQKKIDDANKEKVKAKNRIDKEKKKQEILDLAKLGVQASGYIAAGIAKAWSYGPIVGAALSTVVAAAGAVLVSKIMKTKKDYEQMEQGGLLRGRRHRDGGMRIEGTNIEVEGGEYVINRRSTAKNLGLLEYINASDRALQPAELMTAMDSPTAITGRMKYHLEDGGQVPAVETAAQNNNEQLLDAIRQIKVDSRVAVTDIMSAQDNYAKIEKWVGF